MNPHKMNKIDVSQLSEADQKAFKMYGKLPAKNLVTKMQKERKYFDSGDYMMSKAGVSPAQPLGTAIPTPEGVPHASPPTPGALGSSPTGPAASPGLNEMGSFASTSDKNLAAGNGGNVGVGISPAATSEAVEIVGSGGVGMGHQRRGSESRPRLSPPGILREGNQSSSFPIQHGGQFGSSPVKTSHLARRVDEDMEA